MEMFMFIKEDNMKYDDDAAVAGVRNVGPVASGGHLSLLVTSVEDMLPWSTF